MEKDNNIQHIPTESAIDLKAYGNWRNQLVHQIRQMRFRAAMQLNASNLAHYFHLGQEIIRKQQEMGWGAKVVDILSDDLTKEFGSNSGYSKRNLKYMRQFALEYPHFPFVQVPLAQLRESPIWQVTLAKLETNSKLVPELIEQDGQQFVQVPLAQITWYHHITLIQKVPDHLMRTFYIIKTSQEGWSRDIMLMQIESDAYHRQGMAITNFNQTLPPEDSDLARYMFKDPYNFSFVDMSKVKRETDIENQLILRMTEFLTEMGHDFAYVGHQVKLEEPEDFSHSEGVDVNEDARIDLLLYHLKQHRYVGIELKTGDYKPEFTGKLNYYVSLIDEQFKTSEDKQTIGLLLCRTASRKKVEFAIRGMAQPLGVSEYETSAIAKSIESSIPTINQIEDNISDQSEECNKQ